MKGLLITYNTPNKYNTTKLNHKLFGRITTLNHRGRIYRYYVQGVLDNTKYKKIKNGKYFIENTELQTEIETAIKAFTTSLTFEITDIDDSNMSTAKEHWAEISLKKGYKVKKWTRW